MPSPLSLDLRQRIIDVHTEEAISQRQLAERFQVSLSSIERLLKRFHTNEDIEPKGHGGGYPPTFSPEPLEKGSRFGRSQSGCNLIRTL